MFEKSTGYLCGTTNQLFLNFPKARADIIINIDKGSIIYGNTLTGPASQAMAATHKFEKLKIAKNHTSREKIFLQSMKT